MAFGKSQTLKTEGDTVVTSPFYSRNQDVLGLFSVLNTIVTVEIDHEFFKRSHLGLKA